MYLEMLKRFTFWNERRRRLVLLQPLNVNKYQLYTIWFEKEISLYVWVYTYDASLICVRFAYGLVSTLISKILLRSMAQGFTVSWRIWERKKV